MRFRHIIAAIALALAASAACAQQFTVPLTSKPPVIDGKIEAEEWSTAAGFDGLGYSGGTLVRQRAQAFVAADENNIYLAVRTQVPDEGSLSSLPRSNISSMFWNDDTLSIQVNPEPSEFRQVQYEMLVNHLGYSNWRIHIKNNAAEIPGWEGGWKTAAGIRNGYWELECAIPVKSMGMVKKGRKTTDGVWNIQTGRTWIGPTGAIGSLSCVTNSFGFSAGGWFYYTGVPFRFAKDAPAVAYSVSSDPFLSNYTGLLNISNPSSKPLQLKAQILVDRDRMPEIVENRSLTLAAGEKQSIKLVCPQDDTTTSFQQTISVTSTDGKKVYYERKVKWPREKQPLRYIGSNVVVKVDPLKFDWAYYPYSGKMRLALDISKLPKNVTLTKVTATIREAGTKKTVKETEFPLSGFKSGRQEIRLDLPDLKGQYEIVVRPEGANAPAEIVKSFERNVYEWEHNTLGLSDKVYPPFTPIKVEGKNLFTVLRVHTLNDSGLLDQVTGQSAQTHVTKPMLSAPMRYVAVVNGRAIKVKASPLGIVSAKPNEAITESSFSAGAFKATSRNTWDYDGTLRVDLTILPSDGERVDNLTLEIPFDSKVATMIHANGDRIRAPVAQYLPKDKGVIWDATKQAVNEWPKTFCPYIYIGDAVRGISWFADNDKGWLRDISKPNADVVREGNQVILRIHLISKSGVIEAPRTLTFGLLAAPVKPRVDTSKGPNWWRHRYVRDNYHLLATDINWFALGNCGSVYPAGKDMYLWQMIARGNVEQLGEADIKSVIDRGRKYFEPYGAWEKTFEAHVGHNLTAHYDSKMIFYYNRGSYQSCDEFQTFADEWGISDTHTLEKGNGVSETPIVPCRSYNDYATYWYNKSFDVGRNMGVYWDNYYILPTSNTEMSDAYRNDDGSITPAGGIWALRDLVKRTFVLMNERGMLPVTFPHMTSFNCLPLMSFATAQYDWEWKYSQGDVQDRFSREYILLATTGEQAGVWPVLLSDQGDQANDEWIRRTQSGVRMVHELEDYCPKPVTDILDQPGLDVYRYWDERPLPVSTGNPDIPIIVYSVPGKQALVGIVSFSDRDEQVKLKVNTDALGFTGGYTVTDAENKEQPASLSFLLKKHDMKILRLTAKVDRKQ